MKQISRLSIIITMVWSLLLFLGCSTKSSSQAEALNDLTYFYHYRSLDSVKVYADSVLANTSFSDEAHAEALNHLAFYYTQKMQYDRADSLLKEAYTISDNHIEILIACIQRMKLCQRCSQNKDFYEFRQLAQKHFNRIYEETGTGVRQNMERLTTHQQKRLKYAESEYRLITSVYDYYIGQPEAAITTLQEVDSLPYLKQDTAQYVAYLYDIGSGGILTRGTKQDILHQELELLMQCYVISSDCGYLYWQANALQALSEHLIDGDNIQIPDLMLAQRYLNTQNVPDSLLCGFLAQQSVDMFTRYGDIYQQAAAWRTLSRCYRKLADYPGAIYSLQKALDVDTVIKQSPALMASIHEQFSIVFSAMDMKPESDYHRNLYLDMYDVSRQDRHLEARAEQLDKQVARMNLLITIVLFVVTVLTAVLIYLIIKRHRSKALGNKSKRTQKLQDENALHLQQLTEQSDELKEQCAVMEQQLGRQQETYIEQRAKMHLINSLTPLLDRMLHETSSLVNKAESEEVREERLDYIYELLSRIESENNFLTQWIQLKQGELSLHITSFPIQDLLDLIQKGSTSFSKNNITLMVESSDAVVKADKSLTLFMLNTLCDNARKHTPSGGSVTVSARETDGDMVELSISDTGSGMNADQLAHLFDAKAIHDEQLSGSTAVKQKSHGFGLLNCKGIIEKYKKTNAIFSNCMIDVESAEGNGSRFFFRLPKGIQRSLVLVLTMVCSLTAGAYSYEAMADSVYQCNIKGRYNDAVEYAVKCMKAINAHHANIPTEHTLCMPSDTLMLTDPLSATPAEIRWLQNGDKDSDIPYQLILSLRNEVAVAALALHEWELYSYNNKAYSLLYHELSADKTLEDYCLQMEKTGTSKNVAIIMLVFLLLSIVPIFYFTYYRYIIIDVRKEIDRMKTAITDAETKRDNIHNRLEQLQYEHSRLHVQNNIMANSFSTIKHETMYYPSRIQQLIRTEWQQAELSQPLLKEIDEVAHYYREVYDILSQQAQFNCQHQLSAKVLRAILLRNLAWLSATPLAELQPTESSAGYETYTIHLAKTDDIRLRICTQIARDLGEQYALRRCGIVTDGDNIVVTIPFGK